jgi:Protein phosphatase 2C
MSGSWKFATASIIGTSHQKSPGGVCQDSHAAAYLESATAFIGIVSDGAGSASHAHLGSRLTCDVILREADAAEPAGLFTEAFARDTVEKLRAVLFKEADSKELTISDFACTMLRTAARLLCNSL